MKKLFFSAETILAFEYSGRGTKCLGEHKIDDYLEDLFPPIDEDGNEIEGEYTDDSGNLVGLTTEDVKTGIGTIRIDGPHCIYAKKLGDISFDSAEARSMVRSDGFMREQAILYFVHGETPTARKVILSELDVDMDEWDEYMED